MTPIWLKIHAAEDPYSHHSPNSSYPVKSRSSCSSLTQVHSKNTVTDFEDVEAHPSRRFDPRGICVVTEVPIMSNSYILFSNTTPGPTTYTPPSLDHQAPQRRFSNLPTYSIAVCPFGRPFPSRMWMTIHQKKNSPIL